MQQINLYLPELRPKKEWLTTNTLVVTVVGVACIMLIYTVLGKANIAKLEQAVMQIENQEIVARAQVEAIKSRARPFNSARVDENIERVQKALAARERVGQIIEYQNLGNAEGFSEAFDTMALMSLRTISLEHFTLSDGGRFVEMKGQTIQPKDVATYIRKLIDEPIFSDSRFGILTMYKKEKSQGIHEFSMGYESVYDMVTHKKE